MSISLPLTSWLTSLLLLIVASGLGTFAWWLTARLGAKAWLTMFALLFVFGLVLLFVKVS